MSKPINKAKKKKKNISLGKVHIKVTFNNTHVTFTDKYGNVISNSSAGRHGFKGAKKATPYASQVTVDDAANAAKEHGVKTVAMEIKGPGSQRESAMRTVFNHNFVVTSITDVTGVAHNGTRAPKRRRV